jgi:hypothetical protein
MKCCVVVFKNHTDIDPGLKEFFALKVPLDPGGKMSGFRYPLRSPRTLEVQAQIASTNSGGL